MRALLPLVGLAFLPACVEFDKGGDTASDTADSGFVDTATERGTGDVGGTVRVQLYQTDADGELEDLSWEDYGQSYPFGAIYVAAYTRDEETNAIDWLSEQVISSPSTAGDPWSLSVDLDDAESVYVYAALDWWPDGVIGNTEPSVTHGDTVALVEGGLVDGVDLVINAPLLPTGGGGAAVTISGQVNIEAEYGGGDAWLMLYDEYGRGPSYTTRVSPSEAEGGASGEYGLVVGAGYGTGRLLGAWDNDQNGLIEPTDRWGGYVVADESGNPITVADVDLTGMDVRIPFGLAPELTPFVRLEGTITYEDDFSTLGASATVYVTALRTRPSGDFTVADLEAGYDWASFTGAELSGTELSYLLLAPANATAYLWAYADVDGDGILNEAGEPVASYERTGRITTGTENQTELDMPLQVVTE
jgi:hypothetical protein